MRRRAYDVLIAGARCAGSTLATFLARAGARVLLFDKDALPSDYVLSTHGISPPGIDVLDEVGVGPAVRAVTPPARIIRMNADGAMIDIELPDGRAEYCPRRERLDALLQQAAVGAGAELRDRTRVVSLVREDGRVIGVRAVSGGRETVVTADLVVGADGRHSTVAGLVEAQEYLGYDARRAGYWAYWDAPSFWKTDPAYRCDMYFSHLAGETGVIFPTDHDQLLIGSWPPADRAAAWRADPDGALQATLASEPLIGPLIRDARPVGKVRGTVKERFFFRTGVGAGWALVGDAGHHKDFVIGDGITEALLQARSLAKAVIAGSDAALYRWWRARDVAALPWYFVGHEVGAPGPLPELHRLLFSQLDTLPALKARLIETIDRRRSPLELIPALQLLWWALVSALRGRPQITAELLAAAGRAAATYRELRTRRKLLAEAETKYRAEAGLAERGLDSGHGASQRATP
ncbi:MAG: NAD(P)/FAD-dependent oxidoreductase [Gemmatimonadales bacterium]|nr:NAD(P)/FAD-dependent oxidoreductase [Gemmatimonadales bacterium]